MFKRELLAEQLQALDIDNSELYGKLLLYRELILEWNSKINLTAITDEEEMYLKHFIDSYLILKTGYVIGQKKVLDLGTGAGFPGIPLALLYPKGSFTLNDALNKRIQFLEIVKDALNLRNVDLVHARAEDLAKMDEHRERYDLVVSRAVAELPVLLEYTLPFVKLGGMFIAYKGPGAAAEADRSRNALELLGGEIQDIIPCRLPVTDDERNFILVKKNAETPFRYPRKPGKASKNPL